jgi:hypothetical protein
MSSSVHRHLIDELRATTIEGDPWAHAYLPGCLPGQTAQALWDAFDGFELEECGQLDAAKSYRFATARLDDARPEALPSDEWRRVTEAICGPQYRAALSKLTGVELDGMPHTLSVWEYRNGDWLAPHLDKPEKAVTQIFYFTDAWRDGDGGRLLILADEQASSVRHALPPALGSSAVLVRSEDSWHAVEAPTRPTAPRRSLTLTFWHGTPPD